MAKSKKKQKLDPKYTSMLLTKELKLSLLESKKRFQEENKDFSNISLANYFSKLRDYYEKQKD